MNLPSYPVRNSVKVILLNKANEILLACADDPTITTVEGKYNGRFWFPVGGKIESHESLQAAALREIYEETGIRKKAIELGPLVWFGEFPLVLNGVPTLLKQKFIVAKTEQKGFSLSNLTPEEKKMIKTMAWFSLEQIKTSKEVIYPVVLADYLADILSGNYPEVPIRIDLAKQPESCVDKR